ncbi:YicC family protein [bacterium]|nr:YicC family protein [bacterium]
MLRSMTGYGGAKIQAEGLELQVDIKSVNNRFFDFQPRLSRDLQFLEGEILEKVKAGLGRGRVSVTINMERETGSELPELNEEMLALYLEAHKRIKGAERLSAGNATDLLSLPDLFRAPSEEIDSDRLREMVLKCVDEAVADITDMKEREGAALGEELAGRLDLLESAVSRVEDAVPQMREGLRGRLRERLEELLENVPVDEQRLAMEAAVLVDKADVTEEIVRLQSHIQQFREALVDGGEVSKKLGFLLQEVLREGNTIGSKSQDLAITRDVLLIKEETEKLREQILNLE